MTAFHPAHRPTLRLLPGAADQAPVEHVWFCGYCGARPGGGSPDSPHARVCSSCGLGLLLEAAADLAPGARDAFLVIDTRMRLQALSRRAEQVFGAREDASVDRPMGELLVAADAEAAAPGALEALILQAAAADERATLFVRPRNTFGVRMRARLGTCGPPRAALLVLPGEAPGLRAV